MSQTESTTERAFLPSAGAMRAAEAIMGDFSPLLGTPGDPDDEGACPMTRETHATQEAAAFVYRLARLDRQEGGSQIGDMTQKKPRKRWPKPACPKCNADNLRHAMYDRWHTCKECGHNFVADCSPHKHGGYL